MDKHTPPPDGGPIYAETDLTAWISEPWNAASSIAILFPAIYWAFRLRRNASDYRFLFLCMPFLFLGGLGSTLFHAFRSSRWLLWMDVLPTALLTLMVSIYFWIKILPRWWWVLIILIPGNLLRLFIFRYVDPPASINVSYFITGALIFLPLLLLLRKTSGVGARDMTLSIFFLALALFFRERDFLMTHLFPMGSHFLWHLSSGVGAFYLAKYLYKLRYQELKILT